MSLHSGVCFLMVALSSGSFSSPLTTLTLIISDPLSLSLSFDDSYFWLLINTEKLHRKILLSPCLFVSILSLLVV
jgi:hypothetical protein